jgi:hypothetical protein
MLALWQSGLAKRRISGANMILGDGCATQRLGTKEAPMPRSGPTRKTLKASKAQETSDEAWRIINAEKTKHEARTVKLRAQREARDAAEAAKKTKPKKRRAP